VFKLNRKGEHKMSKKERKEQPIKSVAGLTGLSPHVIRIWEKRYRAVSPERSQTNRRFYTEEDIERLQLLAYLTRQGHRIGQVAGLSVEELKNLVKVMEKDRPIEEKTEHSTDLINQCLVAIENFESSALEICLAKATITMNPLTIIDALIIPLLDEIAERWRQGKLRIVHEHFASGILRPFLANFMKSYEIPKHAPRLISATPAGQQDEFGALFLMSAAAVTGWRAIYLGTNLPAEEIAAAAHQILPKLVSLNIVYPKNDPLLFGELKNLRRLLAPETKILIAGSGANSYRTAIESIGAIQTSSFSDLVRVLESSHQDNLNTHRENNWDSLHT